MTDKILLFLKHASIHFGIAKSLSTNYPCELYAIVDAEPKQKKFFNSQKLIDFKKIWFYQDNVDLKFDKKIDIPYLEEFEKKYQINLWKIALSERYFYKYNRFHKFKRDEILFLLEKECKFFEKILDEVNPNFLLGAPPALHYTDIFYKMCKVRNIRILLLSLTTVGYRATIYDENKKLEFKITEKKEPFDSTITFEDLRNYLTKFDFVKQINKFILKSKPSRIEKYSSVLNFFLGHIDSNYTNHFSKYGMTRLKVLFKTPLFSIKKIRAKIFLAKHSIGTLNSKDKFVYFPLHSEPENTLLVSAPYHSNQLEVITNIAKSLPIGYKLFVKEHPIMSLKGGRDISFYKNILDIPNVELIHSSIPRDKILKNCDLVITIGGTTGFEAALYNKPSIIMIKTIYSSLPSVYTLKTFEEISDAIKISLNKNVDPRDVQEYIKFIEQNSFEYDDTVLSNEFNVHFYSRGFFMVEKKIVEEKMKLFLDFHKTTFDLLASKYMELMRQN